MTVIETPFAPEAIVELVNHWPASQCAQRVCDQDGLVWWISRFKNGPIEIYAERV